MASDRIVIRGAREHNLKSVDLEIPRDQLVVITGLSGSGKSSLAFDTIYAEGQRRYVESLSAYARQLLEQVEEPAVDSIEGLSPVIPVEQTTTAKHPRSTLGPLAEEIELDKKRKHTIEVVVDRLIVRENLGSRLADSLETALRLADGIVTVEPQDSSAPTTFSEKLACAECGISFPEVSPRMFSFNNPYGACPECGGIGSRDEIDPDRLVPNTARALKAGALAPWAGRETTYFRQTLQVLAKRH